MLEPVDRIVVFLDVVAYPCLAVDLLFRYHRLYVRYGLRDVGGDDFLERLDIGTMIIYGGAQRLDLLLLAVELAADSLEPVLYRGGYERH